MKKFIEDIPKPLRLFIMLAVAYKLFTYLSKKAVAFEEKQAVKDDIENYQSDPTRFDTWAAAKNVWACFYDGITQDEETAISVIRSVPLSYRSQFRNHYAEYLLQQKGKNWSSYIWGSYYGKTLQEDCLHFMSSAQYASIANYV